MKTEIAGMTDNVWKLLILIVTLLTAIVPATAAAQTPKTHPQIFFTAFYHGQWDIFSVSPDGQTLWQITNDKYEDADPAISPDGTQLAFASRRNENWDIYLLDLTTGTETQLTTHPHYDAAPAWSPDGSQLAFESFRSGDLDVWLIDFAANNALKNLTADSPAYDFSPAWNDTGGTLFFTSARGGNDDIWALDMALGTVTPLTTAETSESQPAWNTAKAGLGYTVNHLGEKDFWFAPKGNAPRRYTWLGSIDHVLFAPNGAAVAGILHGENADRLIRLDDGNPVPHYLSPPMLLQGSMSWHDNAPVYGTPPAQFSANEIATGLYTETVSPSKSTSGEAYDLVRLNDLSAGSPWLADTVDDSFRAMRTQLQDEVGYDFLGTLSEALRPINFFSDASQYSSWHKSGRAFDTRFDLPGGRLKIVKEDVGGNTYWRVLLRCVDQSGGCGKPVAARPWDYSGRARTVLAPEQGGVEQAPLYGYYVDFTNLAQMDGWQRIASHDEPDFSWTWHFKAFEYWHFQKPLVENDGLSNWYQAMRQVYPQKDVDTYFSWKKMRAANEDPDLIMLKGVPASAKAQRWWQQLAAP